MTGPDATRADGPTRFEAVYHAAQPGEYEDALRMLQDDVARAGLDYERGSLEDRWHDRLGAGTRVAVWVESLGQLRARGVVWPPASSDARRRLAL